MCLSLKWKHLWKQIIKRVCRYILFHRFLTLSMLTSTPIPFVIFWIIAECIFFTKKLPQNFQIFMKSHGSMRIQIHNTGVRAASWGKILWETNLQLHRYLWKKVFVAQVEEDETCTMHHLKSPLLLSDVIPNGLRLCFLCKCFFYGIK